jgi:molecular chaperone DnaJ
VTRDYYAVLGVARDADDATIKKAFRRLARELHPDVSDEPDADERFKEVVEAYEVLSSSERRELYDRFGHEGLRSGGFAPTAFDLGSLSDLFSAFFGDDLFAAAGRRRRGADVGAEVVIDLAESATGVARGVVFEVAAVCETCHGSGAEPGTSPVTCPTCEGRGRLQRSSRTVFGEFVQTQTCPECGGAGRVVESPCAACAGVGRTIEERTVDVTIPAGIHDGQRIRISGEGHAGEPGGQAGDAYVLVRVRPDPRFVREGNDVFSAVDITLAQAALGATIAIDTLDGELELELEPGTQPGDVRILRGRGMPVLSGSGRGDHRVLVNVHVPRRLTAEQRAVLEELAELEDGQMYEDDVGLLGRLKARFGAGGR